MKCSCLSRKQCNGATWRRRCQRQIGSVYCVTNGLPGGCPVDAKAARELATILLVDDDPNILRPLQLLVEREGYRVLTAQDGETALAIAAIESPRLIVTDWMMPRVDGVELCRRLKGDTATADIPVVMLSAALPPHPNEQLWDVLLLKPAPIGRLIKTIHALLEGLRPEAPGRPSRQ